MVETPDKLAPWKRFKFRIANLRRPVWPFSTCLAVLESVRKTREPVLVTRFGKPIAQVLPPPPSPVGDWLGAMKDHGEIRGDLVAPVADLSEWEALK